MPKYCYKCGECEYEFEVRHSMRDRLYNCPECSFMESLVRIPQLINKNNRHASYNRKVGDKVKEYIEANKEILEQQKKERIEEH